MTTSKKKIKATKKIGKLSAERSVKKSASKKVSTVGQELSLKITPQGPSPELLATVSRELLQHASLRSLTAKTRSRLLALELVEQEPETKTAKPTAPSDRFRATIYDYTNNRAITAEGSLSNPRKLAVSESSRQPFPTDEEFDDAVKILIKDPGIGPSLREKAFQPYAPMPPLIESSNQTAATSGL
jgi:hypothetical protein